MAEEREGRRGRAMREVVVDGVSTGESVEEKREGEAREGGVAGV